MRSGHTRKESSPGEQRERGKSIIYTFRCIHTEEMFLKLLETRRICYISEQLRINNHNFLSKFSRNPAKTSGLFQIK